MAGSPEHPAELDLTPGRAGSTTTGQGSPLLSALLNYLYFFKSKRVAGGREKWWKSFSKPTPQCSLETVVSPCPELFSTNTPWGTTAPQKVREALDGMRGNETISFSGLQHSTGEILPGCNGRIKYKQGSASRSRGEGRVSDPRRQLQQGLIYCGVE